MLLPLYLIIDVMTVVIAKVAVVIATVCDSSHFGRCHCQGGRWKYPPWVWIGRCYSQGGRWNSHWVNVLTLILMSCVGPHPICEVDGICLYFYSGIGHSPL